MSHLFRNISRPIVVSKKVALLFLIVIIWGAFVMGQNFALQTLNNTVEGLSIENGYLLSEKRFLSHKVANMEAEIGILKGKNKRSWEKSLK